jgi:hypothetical protein
LTLFIVQCRDLELLRFPVVSQQHKVKPSLGSEVQIQDSNVGASYVSTCALEQMMLRVREDPWEVSSYLRVLKCPGTLDVTGIDELSIGFF